MSVSGPRFVTARTFSLAVVAGMSICLFSMPGTVTCAHAADETLASAKSAFSEGRFRDAVGLYSQAMKQDANQSSLYFERGTAYEMINQHQKAIEDFKKSLELDPANYNAMESLAEIYELRSGRFDDALQLYRRALEMAPEPASRARLQTNIAILENRLQPDDNSPVRSWHLGNIKTAAGDLPKAERFYTKAIRMDPLMFQAYFSRGLLRMKAGYVKEALKDFEETVKISPTLRGAYIEKGLANQRLGNAEQAHQDFENAARMDPRDPYALFYYAGALETKKEFQDALQYYNEAMTRNPKPDLRKLIQERIAALGTIPKAELTKNPGKKVKDLW